MSRTVRGQAGVARSKAQSYDRLARAAVEVLESRRLLSAGGGFTDAGIQGEYFNNTSLTGTPAFTRKDVRVDFDWGTTVKPGGSTAPGFSALGTDNYSVRWTGQVVPRFGETYTFKTVSDDGVRLYIKPTGGSTWTTVVDDWTGHAATTDTGTYTMTAGQAYDIKLEYYEGTGSAKIQLKWSSPSTPEEVIDPLIESGINNPDWSAAFVDITKGATQDTWQATQEYSAAGDPVWNPDWSAVMLAAPAVDSNGWPLGDGSYVFAENDSVGLRTDPLMLGTVTFSFTGKAIVGVGGNVDGNSLAYSYDDMSNTTTGSFQTTQPTLPSGSGSSWIEFHNTQRDLNHAFNTGITDLKMMRPDAPGSTTSYVADGRIFTPEIEDALSHFTVIRHQYVADRQTNWSDRTLPTFFNQDWGLPKIGYQDDTSENKGTGTSWEYKVMLSNETGRDLMISLPVQATDDYLTKLANLIKYGSDGVDPYTSPHTDPVYPPLNPNLRVYLELGNELWNGLGVFAVDAGNLNNMVTDAATDAVKDGNPNADYAKFNFDGLSTDTVKMKDANGDPILDENGNPKEVLDKNGRPTYLSLGTWRIREAVIRMKAASDTFRSVFSDPNMARVRPLYEWQYNNVNDTAAIALTFADDYFNNADGVQHMDDPEPVNAWLWGGGGATYYGSSNPNGLTDLLPDSDFETPSLSTGYHQAPAGADWTFDGTAGIARDGGTGDDIPAPYNGSQVGYITGQGSMTATVTFPAAQTSNVYAVSFKAHNKSGDDQVLRVYLDYGTPNQTDITAKSLENSDGYKPPAQPVDGQGHPDTRWMAFNVWWSNSDYYYTNTFAVDTNSQHTITIVGTSATGETAFLEDVRVTSVDALYAGSAMPGGGEATGQDPGSGIRSTMNGEASWAKAFGLQELSYESGWSLGGDDGGSPLQMQAKYADPRTADVQKTFMDWFYQSGSAVNVFGTYPQWPNWQDTYVDADGDHVQGLEDIGQYPIMQGIDDGQDSLPADVTNGVTAPAVLKTYNATIKYGSAAGQGRLVSAGDFINWNVIVPKPGSYTIGITTDAGSGGYTLLIDGQPSTTGNTVTLTRGLHSIKIRSTSSTAVTVDQVTVVADGAPASPTLSSAVDDGNASATLTWATVTGATGYTIRYGTTPGVYTSAVDAGNATTGTVSGLTAGQHYYFAVGAYNASGEGLPSNEKGVLVVQSGTTGQLLWWEFSGGDPTAASVPVSGATSRVTVSDISRGPGLAPTTAVSLSTNTLGSEPSNAVANHAYGQDLSAAITNGQYYEFTITPASSSYPLTLGGLDFQPYFQDPSRSSLGAGITFSTDGGATFSGGIAAAGTPQKTGSPFHVDLSNYAALQGVTGAITVRIYLFGGGNWEYSGIGGTGDDVSVTGYYGSSSSGSGTPATPSNLSATAASDTAVNLSWTDNSNNETAFGIDVSTDPNFATLCGYATAAANDTSAQITGLTAGTTYYFRIYAGNNGVYSANSNTASATTTNSSGTPTTPSSLAATGVSPTEVDLTWADNSSNETMFGIDVATDPSFSAGSYVHYYSTGAGVTSYHVTGLTAGVTYYFRVFAGNNGNYSANSNTASATTYPNAPSGLTATTVSGTTVNLNWTDNSNNETVFGIDVATDPSFSSGSYVHFYSTGANATFYQITGLSPGTTYYFRVFAGENGVFSYNSNTASATT